MTTPLTPLPQARGYCSGPRVSKFIEGWALALWGRVHYFTREEVDFVKSRCGKVIAIAGGLFHPGNFPRCKTCLKLIREG